MLNFLQHLDGNILLFLQENLRCTALSIILVPLTIFGGCGTMWIIISIILLFRPRTRKAGWMALLSMLLCYIFNDLVVKVLVERPRPFMSLEELTTLVERPTSYSFPSGHSCSSFAAMHIYWLALDIRWFKVMAVVLAVLMAFSRLYVGVHYPTDVLMGALVGFVGSGLIWKVLHRKYDWIEGRILARRHH